MAAELAILVHAVYVFIVIGAIYVGWLSIARHRIYGSNHYAMYPGEGDYIESDVDGPGRLTGDFINEVADGFFRQSNFTGVPSIDGRYADDRDVPMLDELREMFEQFTVPTYHYSVSAQGSFVLDGNTVRYVETVNVNEGFTTRWEGDVVTSLGLLEDDIPYNLTRYLNDYMWRRTAHTSYLHQGHHDRTRAVAGDEDRPWTALGLRIPALSRDTDPQWNPEAAVRGTKVRWAGERPPAAEEREWIGAPNQDDLPAYDPTFDFWHPSDLPPANPNPPAE